jgi:hypothetical protein
VDRGKTEHQHTNSGIPDTQIMWLILNNFSLIHKRDSCTFLILFRNFGHKLHYIKVLQPPYLAAGNTTYQNQHSGIPNTQIMWLLLSTFLMTDKRDSCTFYTLTQTVAFQTLKLCGFSWIISHWYIKETHVLFENFSDILVINYTILKFCNLPN